jgi:ribonuclease P protein component
MELIIMTHLYTFSKQERLCGKISIARLFNEGASFVEYPLRFVYISNKQKTGSVVKVLISVPKKKCKRAVQRNKIKRLIREAYRLNKPLWIEPFNKQQIEVHIALTYITDKDLDFNYIHDKLIKGMKKIVTELSKNYCQL